MRILKLFRILVPSWQFFDAPQVIPVLLHRTGNSAESLGEWQISLPPIHRRAWNLFLNPEHNLLMAEYSLLEQFIDDLNHDRGSVNPISYELVSRLARSRSHVSPYFQWKIRMDEDVFISDVESGGVSESRY